MNILGEDGIVRDTIRDFYSDHDTLQYLSIPSGFTATSLSTSSIKLAWNSVSGATSYKIYQSSSYSGSYYLVTTTSALSWTASSLSSSTTYYYRIMAVGNLASSGYAYANAATASTGGFFCYIYGGSSGSIKVSIDGYYVTTLYTHFYSFPNYGQYGTYSTTLPVGIHTLYGISADGNSIWNNYSFTVTANQNNGVYFSY